MKYSVDVVAHDALALHEICDLRSLFYGEYLGEFGAWDPEQPYGYAGHDVHVIARDGDKVVGHVGWARRTIGVGASELAVAGVGGVLVSQHARGEHVGRQLMRRATASMADSGGIEFGYLGCREEVVRFYVSCGWQRVSAVERSISRNGHPAVHDSGPPLLIFPVARAVAAWPEGAIDLRGRAW